MDFKSLELSNVTIPITQVAYDSSDHSLILANGSGIANYDLLTKNTSSMNHWDPVSQCNTEQIPENKQNNKPKPASLRFSPANSQAKLVVSPSGLIVTCFSIHEELAIAEVGFESGVHYWEIICPKHCKNVNVGVIREGWSIANSVVTNAKLQVHSFKTSTPRVIGLRLDLNKGELLFWLNGNFQPHRVIKNLQPGKWFPCVKLKENGTHIVLNPFATDPDYIYPIYVSIVLYLLLIFSS